MVRQQGLMDKLILKNSTLPNPVSGSMKDIRGETGRGRNCTSQTGLETGTGVGTGTGVKTETMTLNVTGIDGTTGVTIIVLAHIGIVCLIMIVIPRTQTLSATGSGLPSTPGSVIGTGALTTTTTTIPTDTEGTVNAHGGGVVIPTARTAAAAGGGSRTVENPGR